MTYPKSSASQRPGEEYSSESSLLSSTLRKAVLLHFSRSTLFVHAAEIHSAEDFASRYNSWLLILIYKSLFFMAQVLARYLLPWGPPCWEQAGESLLLNLYSWRQGNLSRGMWQLRIPLGSGAFNGAVAGCFSTFCAPLCFSSHTHLGWYQGVVFSKQWVCELEPSL